MRRRYPVEAKRARFTHRYFPNRVRFTGDIPHGKTTREVAIDVDPALICKIADAIRATRDTCAKGRVHEDFNIGHAIWHVDHPDHVMPCLDERSKVIDMQALPAPALCSGHRNPAVIVPSTCGGWKATCSECSWSGVVEDLDDGCPPSHVHMEWPR